MASRSVPATRAAGSLSTGAAPATELSCDSRYRSALHEHDLVVHPARSIQVATGRRVRTRTLSGRPVRIVIEPPEVLDVGRVTWGSSSLSDRHRAVLDAAQRPRLVGGLEVVAEAFAAATPELRADVLMEYACRLGWAAALRRLGSLADALALEPLAGGLAPIKPVSADLDLEPGTDEPTVWRDGRWRVRWPRTVDELLAGGSRRSTTTIALPMRSMFRHF